MVASLMCALACLSAHDAMHAASAASDASTRAVATNSPVAVAQQATPVQVWVAKSHPHPGQVVYRYTVRNGTTHLLGTVSVGVTSPLGDPELRLAPIGWDGTTAPASSTTSPPGWDFAVITTEEESLVTVAWSGPEAEIAGGVTLSGFSVTLSEEDSLYERGHWTVIMDNGPQTRYSGALGRDGDVAASPSRANGNGGVSLTTIADGGVGIATEPANHTVSIVIGMPVSGVATITIFDARGRRIREVERGSLAKGAHTFVWDGRDALGNRVRAGDYLVRIHAPGIERSARINLPK